MSTEHIVSLLVAERDRLEAAIAALQGSASHVKTAPDRAMPIETEAPAPKKKRKLSAGGRRRIVEATKARWAAIRAARTEAAAPAAAPARVEPAKAPVAKKTAASGRDAAYRKMMSEKMRAAWAKRKKAAKKKA
jgi:hypothetical protein